MSRRRLVRGADARGTRLDRAMHIEALLGAAGELEPEAPTVTAPAGQSAAP